jgi:hypothetical protein
MNAHDDIRIGTLVPARDRNTEVIRQLLPHGLETFQISFGRSVGDADLSGLADGIRRALDACLVTGRDDWDVGVAGCRVVRLHVDAASPAYDLAAVHRSLEGDTRHTKRFKVACSYDPVPLQVLKQSLDVAGGGLNRFGRVLRILCRNIFWHRFRSMLVPVWTTVHSRRNRATGRTARLAHRQGSRSHTRNIRLPFVTRMRHPPKPQILPALSA